MTTTQSPTPAASGLKFPESYDHRFWQVGVCGNANIVTYDGEDVHGVAWVSDPHTIVKAHNDCIRQALAAQPAPVVGGDWQVFYLATIKALASMVNVHTPDKLFDLDAIPRDPIMKQVVRIRAAMDDYGKTLLSTRPAESVAQQSDGSPRGLRLIALRNLRGMIERGSTDRKLMLKNLDELA